MERPLKDVRPLGPFILEDSADPLEQAEMFDTEIRYDALFSTRLSESRKDQIEEVMDDAVSGRVEDESYLVIVEDAGLQSVGIVLFNRPISARTLGIIEDDMRDGISSIEDVTTAQPPFIQGGE